MENIFGFIEQRLKSIKQADLYRVLRPYGGAQGVVLEMEGKQYHNFSSNNYLGMADHPEVVAAFKLGLDSYGVGSGASRLICGHHQAHVELERRVAELKGKPAALMFNAGYQANVGLIAALCPEEGVVFSDELNHASIIDGCRLGRAETVVYDHCDVADLDRKMRAYGHKPIKLVVTDGVFSVDGDIAPLAELSELCLRYKALLYVDEAHSGGVFGPHGGGLLEELNLRLPHVIAFGTFSKAFGVFGSYVAAEQPIIDLLVNTCRSFIYSTSLPPALAEACLAAVKIVSADADRRARLWRNVAFLNECFRARDVPIKAATQIVCYPVGPAAKAMEMMAYLKEHGFLVVAIRPPTVPPGSSRLRISLSSEHDPLIIEKMVDLLAGYRLD
ncbi:MAG: 8-amino-7-oxononanoate synthase [Deltaproteobacteria bacterium]|nr:8-amino-7-oxononanoate synthase [Deltaproteobacteria bacterium]